MTQNNTSAAVARARQLFFRLQFVSPVHIDFTKTMHRFRFGIINARQHTDARYWYNKSVCLFVRLSVRLSVCPWLSGIRWKRLNISSQFFSLYGSTIILVLPASDIFTKFRMGHPLRGHRIQVGYINFGIFDQYVAISHRRYKIAP